jgi:hypothetical protein
MQTDIQVIAVGKSDFFSEFLALHYIIVNSLWFVFVAVTCYEL